MEKTDLERNPQIFWGDINREMERGKGQWTDISINENVKILRTRDEAVQVFGVGSREHSA